MNRRQLAWLMAALLLSLLAAVTAPAFPQENEGAAQQEPTAGSAEEGTVENILRQQEQLLTGQRFSYDPGGRRDPFRNLFEPVAKTRGVRPPGIAGMVVEEIDLTGIIKDDDDGDLALLMGSDNKGYFLRAGDAVFDGTVIAIDPRLGTVTFRQQIDDPRRIKPYRDVVKRLVPLEDEERADE